MNSAAAAEFWDWFVENEEGVAAIVDTLIPEDIRSKAYLSLSEAFEVSYPNIIVEVGPADVGTMLVVTADGKRDLFPAVIACVAAAPALQNWRVQAFRPRLPDCRGINIFGVNVEPEDLHIVFDEPSRGKVDLEVILRSDEELSHDQLATMAFLVLDGLLGEWDVETYVASVGRVQIAVDEPWPEGALPLDQSREAFDRLIAPHRRPQ